MTDSYGQSRRFTAGFSAPRTRNRRLTVCRTANHPARNLLELLGKLTVTDSTDSF